MSWYEDPGPPPAGWYPDPGGQGQRWWDGQRWTEHYAAAPQPVVPQPVPGYFPPAQQAPQLAPQPPAAPVADVLPPTEFWVAFVAIVLLAAGSVAPWVTLQVDGFGDSLNRDVGGLRGDGPGVLTLLSAVTAGILVCLWLFERAVLMPAAAVIVALVAVVVAALHIADPAGDTDVPASVDVGVGWGSWVALVAALTLAAACAVMAVRSRTRRE